MSNTIQGEGEMWVEKVLKMESAESDNNMIDNKSFASYLPYSNDVKWYINFFEFLPEVVFDFYYEGSMYTIDIERVDKWLTASNLVVKKMINKTCYDMKRGNFDMEELSNFYILTDRVYMRIQEDKLIIIAPDESNVTYKKVYDFLKKSFRKIKMDKEFFILNVKNNHFVLKSIKIKAVEIDLNKNYNDDFIEFNKNLVKDLESDKSGIILLHGEPGTGKTTYLKKLIMDVDKKFIYINPAIVSSLLSPEFVDFMVANSDSILIIEEAEKIIKDRNNIDASQSAISNLLNISDGLMSDALAMKIICTFNADIKDIDKALMRKGRIMSKYEFKALEKDKAQVMINDIHPNENIVIDKKMTLAEIYNFNKKDYQIKQNSIGFGR